MDKTNTITFPTKPLPEVQPSAANPAPRIIRVPTNPFLLTILITLHDLHSPFLPFLPYWFRVLLHNALCTLNAALLNLADRISHVGYDPCDERTKHMVSEIWRILLFILELFPPTLRPYNVLDLLDGYIDCHWPEDLPPSVREYDEDAHVGACYPFLTPYLTLINGVTRARCESNASTDSEVSYIKRHLERNKRDGELKFAGCCEGDDDEYEGGEEEGKYEEAEDEQEQSDTTEENACEDRYEEDENEAWQVKEPIPTLRSYKYLPFRL
ncbi:hypothetical protein BJ165DRAFT_1598516 [Panaeolus papilionaceus]|nr:hypothetical protein BJ165DRAFT_1598516 [Panaeolus papilionaceus]